MPIIKCNVNCACAALCLLQCLCVSLLHLKWRVSMMSIVTPVARELCACVPVCVCHCLPLLLPAMWCDEHFLLLEVESTSTQIARNKKKERERNRSPEDRWNIEVRIFLTQQFRYSLLVSIVPLTLSLRYLSLSLSRNSLDDEEKRHSWPLHNWFVLRKDTIFALDGCASGRGKWWPRSV